MRDRLFVILALAFVTLLFVALESLATTLGPRITMMFGLGALAMMAVSLCLLAPVGGVMR
jgi:predicted membrane channel-forming protein YqfA (hemolysin III family)